jgi:hypothetical protein
MNEPPPEIQILRRRLADECFAITASASRRREWADSSELTSFVLTIKIGLALACAAEPLLLLLAFLFSQGRGWPGAPQDFKDFEPCDAEKSCGQAKLHIR